MRAHRGDIPNIVLLPIAFTTGSGGKVRPALVVQSDHNNVRLNAQMIYSQTIDLDMPTIRHEARELARKIRDGERRRRH
jgi:hypothetical protein